ncbi:SRPBCC family protein [Azohydromonas lata]|uniref:SRPBCC family protein n=1 Tax=Azohydromonas lata TaxID=45677 RepID=A0ABU5I955_9BURK|nr:SRPBCC family protein [Azohydromonas lata]MDZ5455637.1 SRPBCC family protein [Azohydromonas lata]
MDQPLHLRHRTEVLVDTDAQRLFDHLDDPRRLSAHMAKPSAMMAGASMVLTTDDGGGRSIGSVYRLYGKVLGLELNVSSRVEEREPPWRKIWRTVGEPRLLVVGRYRMGFDITPLERGCRLGVFIEYAWPARHPWLGRLFGAAYARWCTRRMAFDAKAAFP